MLVRHAIFPVAGLGTRFLPATKALPKEMLPIVDKPLMQYAVEEAYAAGIRQMIFVTGRHKRAIEDHFDLTFELEDALEKSNKADLLATVRAVKPDDMDCVFVRQPKALGLGHAVLCGRHVVGDHPFAVLLPDDLMIGTPPILAQMVAQFEAQKASIVAVQEVPAEHTRRYGIVAGNAVGERLVDITRIVEKPAPDVAPSRLGVAGRYVLTPRVFDEIASQPRGVGGEIQLTDGIAGLLKHEKVFAYRYDGKRYDCGSKEGFLQANVELALANPELGPEFRTWLQESELRGLAPAQEVHELVVRAGLLEQLVAGLAGEGLEVAHRPRVGGDDLEDVAARHLGERLLRLEDRQGAVQAAGIELFVGFHGWWSFAQSTSTSVARLPGGSSMYCGSMPRERSQSASAWPVPAGQHLTFSGAIVR